jgi:hypothetical protein
MAKCTEYIISGDICNSQLLFCVIIIFIREKRNITFWSGQVGTGPVLQIKYFNLLYFKLLEMNVGVNIP